MLRPCAPRALCICVTSSGVNLCRFATAITSEITTTGRSPPLTVITALLTMRLLPHCPIHCLRLRGVCYHSDLRLQIGEILTLKRVAKTDENFPNRFDAFFLFINIILKKDLEEIFEHRITINTTPWGILFKNFYRIINSSSPLNAERGDAITGTSPLMLSHEQRWLVLACRLLILSRSQTTHILGHRQTTAIPLSRRRAVSSPIFTTTTGVARPRGAVYGSRLLISTSSAEIRPEFLPLRERIRTGAATRAGGAVNFLKSGTDGDSVGKFRSW